MFIEPFTEGFHNLDEACPLGESARACFLSCPLAIAGNFLEFGVKGAAINAQTDTPLKPTAVNCAAKGHALAKF